LRQQPSTFQGASPPTSFLKHADEQTVAGLAVVSRAVEEHHLGNADFSQWGVIAAPRFLGRAALAVALARFAAEGAWGISPHLIPHRSLHSLSGTVSQALKIHGPNYGVGGGSDGAAEALLAGSAMLADGQVPGLWLILTGFDPELEPNDPTDGNVPLPNVDCVAAALALIPATAASAGPLLSISGCGAGTADTRQWPWFNLEDFADVLGNGTASGQWRLRCGGWLRWEPVEAAVEICP
jgi:hypothetical protein